MEVNDLTGRVIGACIEVHRTLGPGLLDLSYQQCLARELTIQKIGFQLEVPIPVEYKGVHLDCGYRIDILIEDRLLLELKAVDKLLGIYQAQILTYMKLSGVSVGLLINFNSDVLKDGIKRLVPWIFLCVLRVLGGVLLSSQTD